LGRIAGISRTTVNKPKESYVYSDFDYPESVDEFPTAGQIRSYLESYVEYFDLNPHIRLETEVIYDKE